MIHSEKIKEFQNYLNNDFSGKTLGEKYDAKHKAEVFELLIDDNTVVIRVLNEFFNDNEVNEFKKKLKDFRLNEFIRQGWSKQITVTKFGIILEDY